MATDRGIGAPPSGPRVRTGSRLRTGARLRVGAYALIVALAAGVRLARPQDTSYADFNHDGVVSREEGRAYADMLWITLSPDESDMIDASKVLKSRPEVMSLLEIAKPRPDGLIYKADFIAAMAGRFSGADRNGDGVLDAGELPNYLGNGR